MSRASPPVRNGTRWSRAFSAIAIPSRSGPATSSPGSRCETPTILRPSSSDSSSATAPLLLVFGSYT